MRCERFRRWRERTTDGVGLPDELARHVAGCPDCEGLSATYRTAIGAFRDAVSVPPPAMPDPALLHLRVGEQRAVTLSRPPAGAIRWPWVLVPAAAAVVVAVVAWTISTDPGRADGASSAGAVMDIRPGQTIEAGAGGTVLSVPGAGRLVMAPGARTSVDAGSQDHVAIRLEEGRVDAEVPHRDPGQSYEIRTPYAVVRVVGTRFTVLHLPGVATEITVHEGVVAIDTPTGNAVVRLPAGGSARVGPSGLQGPAKEAAEPEAEESTAPSILTAGERPPPTDAPAGSRPVETASLPTAIGDRVVARRPASSTAPTSQEPYEDVVVRVRRLMAAGRETQALLEIETRLALAAAHQRPRLMALAGDAHRLAGHVDEARAAYESALSLWPGTPPEDVCADLATLLQDRMQQRADAARVWRRYLDAWPRGIYAGRALRLVADDEESAGRPELALALRARLIDEQPQAPEAVDVLVQVGREALSRGDLDGAARWFEGRTASPAPGLSEAALVGMLRVRMQQGRADDVRALAAEHARRFPVGQRRDEVVRLVELAGLKTR